MENEIGKMNKGSIVCGPLSAQGHSLLARPSQLPHSLAGRRRSAARCSAGGGHRAQRGRCGAASRGSLVVPEWHSWYGELDGASVIVPGKEIGAAAHPSGRSTSRRRHRLGAGTSTAGIESCSIGEERGS
jgi:hypothetical protein